MSDISTLRIGTRGSPLALQQTGTVVACLRETHEDLAPTRAVETIVIKTTGDRVKGELLT